MTIIPTLPGDSPLHLDCAAETARIADMLTDALSRRLRRRGLVVGISGGIDSAVCAALAAHALGPKRVLGVMMPERESSPGSTERGLELARRLGITYRVDDITATLEAAGAYTLRDEAIRQLFPNYGPGWRQKIVLASDPLADGRLGYFDMVVEAPDGERRRARMPAEAYLQVVAATNLKQRTRKMTEYTHADRLNYAVLGTPNRLEYELGFFVRGGDGLADIKPIAHLYKSQVYAMAEHLGVPVSIRSQPPSTDTYTLEQSQEEFYFSLPWNVLDQLLWAQANQLSARDAAAMVGLEPEQVVRAWRDFAGKRRAAERGLADAIVMQES